VLYRAPRQRYPLAVSARGMRITDSNGKRYLDMSGGAAVSCLGHGDPDVIAAIHAQLQQLAFAHTAFFTNEPQEQLAAALAARFHDPGARVYFLSGGSEANETAFKIAWQYWAARGSPTKKIIISREHSYHGNTFGGLSVSGNELRRRASAAPLIDWPRIPPCYQYRELQAGEDLESYSARAATYLQDAIDKCGAENVAAFICEPVVGSSLGVVAATPGYLQRIRDICDNNDILMIADEIMCGSGRTGNYFAHQFDGVTPDIVTVAKGIGGGYQPLAAAVIGSGVASVLTESGFAHGHTYIGHATACAAGVAVQQALDRYDLLQRTQALGERFLSLLRDAFAHHPHVGDVRGRGLFVGIELVHEVATREGFADRRGLPEELRILAMEQGLICYPGGILVNDKTVPHIMLAPPMIAEDRHLLECVDKLTATLHSAFKM
jgi:adenosylmethionine-8-amino-7-oxononanoate aminotransferase